MKILQPSEIPHICNRCGKNIQAYNEDFIILGITNRNPGAITVSTSVLCASCKRDFFTQGFDGMKEEQ